MDKLANLISRLTGQPVVNATALAGTFSFTLEWTPDEIQRGGPPEAAPPPAPVEVLVIDRIDRVPTEN